MQWITEAQVATTLTPERMREALRAAFLDQAAGRATVLARSRAGDPQAGMVSAMGAVLPSLDVLGTKVYSTRKGQFQFLVNLFAVSSGLPLATLEANELTRLRTAATTALAVDLLAKPAARTLAVFGTGVQARAHLEAVAPLRSFQEIRLCTRGDGAEWLSAWAGRGLRLASAAEAAQADVVLTCTRATEPLFDGALVRPGALVAAVGSSKPVARELDDTLLARAGRLVVEWKSAALAEAGEFCRAAPGVVDTRRVVELGALLAAPPAPSDGITVFKSVGIGLEDVAVAHAVWRALNTSEVPA
ncbi:ornithine cyclodeaminase family protein [Inhella sp.]|uniref:ornithine cyclodeaminase family protein n=1 Tax=Inhella sp. TaxID=1921806 RepID=UPI0035ADF944